MRSRRRSFFGLRLALMFHDRYRRKQVGCGGLEFRVRETDERMPRGGIVTAFLNAQDSMERRIDGAMDPG